jgi:hypothetical protein
MWRLVLPDRGRMTGKPERMAQVLINALTGELGRQGKADAMGLYPLAFMDLSSHKRTKYPSGSRSSAPYPQNTF